MLNIVSRNTIQLAPTASVTTDYYKGYAIVVKRFDPVTGKELEQKKVITAYNGSTKIATIDGIWDADFIPGLNDTYRIVPVYADSRVSINPAIQTLDYITSKTYGKGLHPEKDLNLPTWLGAARHCDTQSDVTVETVSALSNLSVGAVYRFFTSNTLHWQGEVHSINGKYVRFTKVIGKLTNKWNSWKTFKAGSLVYRDNTIGRMTVTATLPSGLSGAWSQESSITLTKLSGTGPTTLSLATDGNPIRTLNERGIVISGYSLYDSDGIDYWRYLGWDQHDQRFVTRHQANLMIDTSVTVFDNLNSLLEHFGGILRYTSGKYELEVEQGEGVIPSGDVRIIDADQIIGKVRISDEGVRSSFNSLAVAYADPANNYEARNISFFNSEFLKADRNVPKKGNVSIPGITNYYNARLLADKFLIKSRFGTSINFTMTPKGALLLAGKVIEVTVPRYGWDRKRFRIENLKHNNDTTVDIVAKEYDDKFYAIKNVSRPPATGTAGSPNTRPRAVAGGLVATSVDSDDERIGGVELLWDLISDPDPTIETEIWHSPISTLMVTIQGSGSAITTSPTIDTKHNGMILTAWENVPGFMTKGEQFELVAPPPLVGLPAVPPWLKRVSTGLTVTFNGISRPLQFCSATVLDTVPSNVSSYIDIINTPPNKDMPLGEFDTELPPEVDPEAPEEPEEPVEPEEPEVPEVPWQDRIEKYYWIRHKITEIS